MKKEKVVAPPPERPEKPTTNGHYMGKNTGFEYRDGEYGLAPTHRDSMEEIMEEQTAIRLWLAAQNEYAGKRFKELGGRQNRWWKYVYEDGSVLIWGSECCKILVVATLTICAIMVFTCLKLKIPLRSEVGRESGISANYSKQLAKFCEVYFCVGKFIPVGYPSPEKELLIDYVRSNGPRGLELLQTKKGHWFSDAAKNMRSLRINSFADSSWMAFELLLSRITRQFFNGKILGPTPCWRISSIQGFSEELKAHGLARGTQSFSDRVGSYALKGNIGPLHRLERIAVDFVGLIHCLPLLNGKYHINDSRTRYDNRSYGYSSIRDVNFFHGIPPSTEDHPYSPKWLWWVGILTCGCGLIFFIYGFIVFQFSFYSRKGTLSSALIGIAIIVFACLLVHIGLRLLSTNTVPHKYLLTSTNYWGTVIGIGRTDMANNLSTEKQIAVISSLAEGSSIRSIERITGVHRDTIMRLGVRVGKSCQSLLDAKMRNLSCQHLQFDEIWGFIGKKERHCTADDSLELGDVWTFCAIDSDTKLVPSFKVGKRDSATANAFVADVASRLKNRVQVSTDALGAYVQAVEQAFGANVDYAQIVKVFEDQSADAEVIRMDKTAFTGRPDMTLASTSHVERLNGTTRLHMRRLTRLTYAFSKKLENFEAAVALHFAYYNFVKRHNTLRCTPAMAAGVERDFWSVGQLIEAIA